MTQIYTLFESLVIFVALYVAFVMEFLLTRDQISKLFFVTVAQFYYLLILNLLSSFLFVAYCPHPLPAEEKELEQTLQDIVRRGKTARIEQKVLS